MRQKQLLKVIIGILAIMALTLTLGSSAWAGDRYKTLHRFKSTGVKGSRPEAGLIFDAAGNLYGTTHIGGAYGVGTVFELTPNADGGWTESVLHSFSGGSDGGYLYAGLIFDAAGNLYGTTFSGGAYTYHGTVFELTPNGDGSWTESVLHSFNGSDGNGPHSSLTFDAAGNLYGTTYGGGGYGDGTVFELTPNGDGSWTERVLHSFNGSDGCDPDSSLIFDAAGNLYGTTVGCGPRHWGTVFELTPNGDGSWTERVLLSFKHWGFRGFLPYSSLIFDAAGNLYGTTAYGGAHGGAYGYGTVFELTPNGDGSWTATVLHSFNATDGASLFAGLIFDAAGNLYGTTAGGGLYGYGVVFKLRPTSAGGWRYHVLHSFKNHPDAFPQAGLVLDQTGNLYGTTYGDGTTTFGSVFEYTLSPDSDLE